MTRPHPTLAEPTAIFVDALSGVDGTSDPMVAMPLPDRFVDATADVTVDRDAAPARRRLPESAAAGIGAPSPGVSVPPVTAVAAPAPQPVPAAAPAPRVRPARPAVSAAVPGLAPRRPAGFAPERVATSPGRSMPVRYSAPQYPPAQNAPGRYTTATPAPGQYPAPAGPWQPGQWPPPAPPRAQAPPRTGVPQRVPARPAAAPRLRGTSYPARTQTTARSADPYGHAPARRRRSGGGWAVLFAVIVFLVISGTGRELLDAIMDLLNR